MKPDSVNILGKTYKIEYVDKPSDVDIYKRESLWGQIDYWTRTIRVYAHERTSEDVFETLVHEILHGISDELKLPNLGKHNDQKCNDELNILSVALADTFTRNGWIKMKGEK